MFLLDLFILGIRCERVSSGVTDYLDLIKYTQSYIKGFIKSFIKGYIDLIFIRYDIGFIYMDFNTFIYINLIRYGISITVVISIGDSISIIIVFFVKTSIGFIYMGYKDIIL